MKTFTNLTFTFFFILVMTGMVLAQGNTLIYDVTAKNINDNSSNNDWQDRVVKLRGQLSAQGQDDDEFEFKDGSGTLEYYVEFDQDITYPSTLNKDITIYAQLNIWFGGVNVNAHYWYYDDSPPSYVFDKKANEINSGMNNLPVVVVGKLIGQTSGGDSDQYDFQDDTGTIIADWDDDWSNPTQNTTMTIYGLVDWYNQVLDIDVKSYVMGTARAIEDISMGQVPGKFELQQNYPNPFNPTTNIHFSISKNSHVKLQVYTITGQLVAVLVNEEMNSGTYNVDFNANGLPTGVYFYQITADNFVDVKRMTLVK